MEYMAMVLCREDIGIYKIIGFDKFDGTGPSGMNVNYQLGNNYIIQEQWPLGVVNFI
jgi:hypothetical protein